MTDEKKEDINLETLEGGEDLMIEVDGELVPNYDATMVTFEERDIVTGTVVRIDNDEVLVDIGYKSEGVIPVEAVSYTHLRAHETDSYLVCRLLLEKKKTKKPNSANTQT